MTTIELNPPPQEDDKEAAIIAGARKAFLAKGFDAASMDTVALMAGVSKRTVYNRFRSKEELFIAAIMDTCRRLLPVDIEAIEASLPPEEFIRQMARRFLRAILEPEAIALRRIATFEAGRTAHLGRAYLEHGPRWLVKTCAPILKRLAERGALRVDDAEGATWRLGALITEPLYTEVLLGDPPADIEAAVDAQIESGLSAFMRFYRA
ncbi:TetR/AcrR family transcriptional regulator [Amphiplicatus metriothermophilus]|uniref:Transcriptional regulator, TetR family n=1 Tax=Amphiplicatus metriothermophilus TaxID=1519374 RepID=A0A239PKC5_9PROT|nr:TetR/AcrR family transcriptional regulator [Amphiplicatus metriothermophilus]MBB5517419.1 TetR/AcrR family transcriptional repressor of mexJK operon [Amphiplicatus metriothermophilus]SNT68246.1 transcriptional regulator, TetR family [Amphiplicatus metriothermophilus]